MSSIRIPKALQDEGTRGKIIGATAVGLELFLLFGLLPRLAWVNGSYVNCAMGQMDRYLDKFVCSVAAPKDFWDYTPTFLSADWNLTHLTALLFLAILNVLVMCAYGLYARFGQEASIWISQELHAHKMRKLARQDQANEAATRLRA